MKKHTKPGTKKSLKKPKVKKIQPTLKSIKNNRGKAHIEEYINDESNDAKLRIAGTGGAGGGAKLVKTVLVFGKTNQANIQASVVMDCFENFGNLKTNEKIQPEGTFASGIFFGVIFGAVSMMLFLWVFG